MTQKQLDFVDFFVLTGTLIIKVKVFVSPEPMGAVVCRSASLKESPRDTEAIRRSLFGGRFKGRECDCDDLFCLVVEKRGQANSFSRCDEPFDVSMDTVWRAENIPEIKAKFRSSHDQNFGKNQSREFQSSAPWSVSCPELRRVGPKGIAETPKGIAEASSSQLKNLKPLPKKIDLDLKSSQCKIFSSF